METRKNYVQRLEAEQRYQTRDYKSVHDNLIAIFFKTGTRCINKVSFYHPNRDEIVEILTTNPTTPHNLAFWNDEWTASWSAASADRALLALRTRNRRTALTMRHLKLRYLVTHSSDWCRVWYRWTRFVFLYSLCWMKQTNITIKEICSLSNRRILIKKKRCAHDREVRMKATCED